MRIDRSHWRAQREKASGFWQMKFMLGAYRFLGAKGLRFVLYPIVFFFFAFAPGVVVMAWTEDKNDPQYAYCQETYRALSLATDAKGRKLEIHHLLVPSPALFMSQEECHGLVRSASTLEMRSEGRRLAASYVNFYQGKDFVIVPQFGVKEDRLAVNELSKIFPDKVIHPVNTREILLGGGNIHCITMQVPLKEE